MSMLQNKNGSSTMDGLWNTMVGSYGSYKAELTLSELDIYGSKRLGVIQDTTTLSRFHFSGTYNPTSGSYMISSVYSPTYTALATNNLASWYYGKKQFELTNHLGNLLATYVGSINASKGVPFEIYNYGTTTFKNAPNE